MKILNNLGILVFFVGVIMLAYAQMMMNTTVEIPITSGLGNSGDSYYNIGLIAEKLNNTIVAGILIISGLVMACANEGNREKR